MKDKLALFFLFFLGIIFYVLTIKGIYGNPPGTSIKNNLDQATKPFELSPERDRYLLTQSLAQNSSFALSQKLADAAYPDVGYYNGRFYIFFAPGISLFAWPFYVIGSHFQLAQIASYFLISLFAVANLLLLFKISREILKLPLWISLITALIFAFGCTAWSYAVTLYQHQSTTFFIMSGFYAVWKYKEEKRFSFIWGMYAWLSYGLAILIDYPNGVLMLPVMVYFFVASWKTIQRKGSVIFSFRTAFIATSVLFVILTIAHGYYNYVNFGSWKKLSGSITGYKAIKEQKIFQKKNAQQVIKKLSDKKDPVGFFKEDALVNGTEILLFSRDRGIFFYSPIFFLGILGIFYALRKNTIELSILIGLIAINFFLYSSWGDPWGGWAFGPRYLIPTMATLSLFVGIWLSKIPHVTTGKIIVFLLFMYSSAISLLGVLTTNAVPPKPEAIYLKTQYGYSLNYLYLMNNSSSSFLYNNFFSSHISLVVYYLVIYQCILLLIYIVLFLIPYSKKYVR